MFMWTAALTQMNSGTGKCIYEHFLSIYENMMEDGEFFFLSFIESEKTVFSVSWQIDQKYQNPAPFLNSQKVLVIYSFFVSLHKFSCLCCGGSVMKR